MAQVDVDTQQHIELLLSGAIEQWSRLPEVESEIDEWDLLDQITFVEEWLLEEQRLERLAQYVADGVLTSEQLTRYRKIQLLVAQNRPIVERLRRA